MSLFSARAMDTSAFLKELLEAKTLSDDSTKYTLQVISYGASGVKTQSAVDSETIQAGGALEHQFQMSGSANTFSTKENH